MRCRNVMALIYVNLFLEDPKLQVLTSYSTNSSGYTWARSKITTSCCVVFGSLFCRLRFDELPQDCFVVLCLLVHQCLFPFSHLHLFERSLSHDRLDTSG